MNETTNTEAANPVEPLVSLRITDETELTQRSTMFGDGKDGSFMQEYSLFVNDKETGVTMLVTGNLGQSNTKRRFTANGEFYDTVKEAFEAAGHEWVRAS